MSPNSIEGRIVRYGELVPCRTAFIDAHTPGSDRKENFTIIGGGVSESRDQHVHIKDTPGFNIGAAGQPPHCRNSLHIHRTAEVFFVLSGRWRFFWGRWGSAGEVVLEEGDIFNIPTGIFRGFENVGTDYGMIMAILGGDDAGGGVVWAPQVLEEAQVHGLVLGANGRLYNSHRGERLPEGLAPMPPLGEAELAQIPEPSAAEIVPEFVARHLDLLAVARDGPCPVIGAQGRIMDRPGFDVDFLTRGSVGQEPEASGRHRVLMVAKGHWWLEWDGGGAPLAKGDVCAVPPGLAVSLAPAMEGEAALYRVWSNDDPAGLTRALV